MSITLNGTEGITLDNGSADGAQVTLASSGYSNWNLDNYSGRFRAYYNATEYFTIDASGNVGIGTSSTGLAKFNVSDGTVNIGTQPYAAGSNGYFGCTSNHNLCLTTNNTERMRITSAGGISFGSSGTAYGTSGQVLTSNGNAAPTWNTLSAVTSLNGQTGAITNTDYGAIGSYVIASTTFSASATISANTTVAGSTLNRTDYVSAGASTVARPLNGLAQGNVSVTVGMQTSLGLSGTWRAMTYAMNSTAVNSAAPLILWVRIS